MHHELQTLADPDPDAVARAGAAFVAASLVMADRAAT
jgi:hypothetical protein